jgi:chorismate mutase
MKRAPAGTRRRPRDIADWRAEIDAIDDRLVALLNKRAVCAIEIGKLKRVRNLPIHVPEREMEVLDRVSRGNRGPLVEGAIRRLFERIIDESRSIERLVAEALDRGKAKGNPGRGRGRGKKGRTGR